MLCAGLVARAQLTFENSRPVISLDGRSVIEAPAVDSWQRRQWEQKPKDEEQWHI